MRNSALPALSESRNLRFATLALLYSAQGLPWGLFIIALPAWLAHRGVSLAQIAFFQFVVILPWSVGKLFAALLMDRVSFPAMGRRRPWILAAQCGLVAALLSVAAAPDPVAHLGVMTLLVFFVNVFAASQDVATDGMSIDILPENERASANAFMFGGQLLGISAAGIGGSYLMNHFGMYAAALAAACAAACVMLAPLALRERPGERLLPWTEGVPAPREQRAESPRLRTIFPTLFRGLVMPMSLLLLVINFLGRTGSGMLDATLPVFAVQQLGWSNQDYSSWQSLAQLVAAGGGILGGLLVDRFGARRVLGVLVAGRLAIFAAVGLQSALLHSYPVMVGMIMAEAVLSQSITVSVIAVFMNLCVASVAATQFAVYMASANLALNAGSLLTSWLARWMAAPGLFLVMAGLNVGFLALWPLFSLERHRHAVERRGEPEVAALPDEAAAA